ncbi:MAG: DNA polymerase IV [Anaerolineales bacterium]
MTREWERVILNLDLDAFFCAVEERRDPSLRGKAFAVGGAPSQRGVVASCSYAARKYGIHSAMPMAEAVQKYPPLIVISSNHSAYQLISKKVMGLLYDLTDQVEQLSIDEAFLDISPIEGSPQKTAEKLQRQIRETYALPSSLGIASNKLVAKIATDVGKLSHSGGGPPNAITVVPPGEEAAFLDPLPVDMLWGVGPKTKEQLGKIGIQTIGDLARYPTLELAKELGKHGYDLSKRAQGEDDRPIVTERTMKSVSHETTFSEDIGKKAKVLETLNSLAHKVARRLQKNKTKGRTIHIKLRWSDFQTLTRQNTLDLPTDDPYIIIQEAEHLLDGVWKEGNKVRLVGVGVSNLNTQAQQLTLWDPAVKKDLDLQKVLDTLREKYGEGVIKRGIG